MAKILKKGKKVEKIVFGEALKFPKVGTEHSGKVLGLRETTTTFGESQVVDMVNLEGEKVSLFLSSNLMQFDWNELVGEWINVQYTEDAVNEKSKRTYKVYEIEILEVDEKV
jgi:hypothetical protein